MLNKIILLTALFITNSLFSQDNPFFAPGNSDRKVQSEPLNSFLDTNLSVQGVWSRLNNLPKSIMGVNSYYYSVTNKIFICGGIDQNSLPNDTCWWYDIAGGNYQLAASLPVGRWSGKLVKVKDNLYLVGSVGAAFNSADGIIYKYSLLQNIWSISDTMPAPFVHEPAVCVFKDSLIFVIGGSTNAFLNPINSVRVFNPSLNTWQVSTPFPVNVTTAHAEFNYSVNDSVIFVAGGYNAGNLNTVYKGSLNFINSDTLQINWQLFSYTPFSSGIYRVAGSKWKNYVLFGPAMNGGTSLNQIWGLSYYDSVGVWTSFSPVSDDTVGNISTFAAVSGTDSNYFYLFGGYKNPNILNRAQKYTFLTPPPIGIISQSSIPVKFKLYQNYPNPFNPVTKIRFDLPKIDNFRDLVKLAIYDILGRLTAKYEFTNIKAGSFEIVFDGTDLSSGLYFYSLSSGDFHEVKKMVLLK